MIKEASLLMEEKTLKMVLRQIWLTIWKKIKLNPCFTWHTRINSEWIRGPIVKMKPK